MLDFDQFTSDLKKGCKIACFGSRETPDRTLKLMECLGEYFVRLGGELASGHCDGADLAWERGACAAKPENFTVCLPWASYNKNYPVHPDSLVVVLDNLAYEEKAHYFRVARQHHPLWDKLSPGVQLLHGRNILIGKDAKYGFTYLNSKKPGGGGSGQCARYLKSRGVPVIDLAKPEEDKYWRTFLSTDDEDSLRG